MLEYREPFTFDCFDGDWCARNRVNSSTAGWRPSTAARSAWAAASSTPSPISCRRKSTSRSIRSTSRWSGGKRQDGYAQLCCTNEDVIRLCTEGILAAMQAQPEAFVFSVSQNDTDNHCECERCQALAKAEESQDGPGAATGQPRGRGGGKEFPDKAVETLAYQWTRKPPKDLRPRPNVIIRLCSIECCFSHPLATCDSPANRAFRRDLEGWAKVSKRLWVWDYVTDFSHYLLPFPNQRVRKANIRFFVRNNVKGIFEQDTYDTPHSEMVALGGYLTAKFLWNPDYDEKTAMHEFLEGYYGKAAGPIRKYLDLIHDHVERKNIHVNIWAQPSSPHLTNRLLAEANTLWQEAEKLAAGEADVLRRVKLSRMSVDFAIVERVRIGAGKGPSGENDLAPLAKARFEPFMATLGSSGLTNLREGQRTDFADYRSKLAAALGVEK